MTGFFLPCGVAWVRTPIGPPAAAGSSGSFARQPCPLTVPLLYSARWRWLELERPHQVQRRLAQAHLPQSRPQLDHVPLFAAAAVEAAEHVLAQVHAERPAPPVAPVDRAGATPLRPAPAQPPR